MKPNLLRHIDAVPISDYAEMKTDKVVKMTNDPEDDPGDFVLFLEFGDATDEDGLHQSFHVNKGMDAARIAEGLRILADAIEGAFPQNGQ